MKDKKPSLCVAILALWFVTSQPTIVSAQKIRVLRNGEAVPIEIMAGRLELLGGIPGQQFEDQEDGNPEAGATLKTDPRLESILEKADRFREDGNYRFAAQLWQAVLLQSGDALFSQDDETYFSLVQQVENIIASLPPEGLENYRITADASAKEIMAQADSTNLASSLNQVVRQYFLSSLGDDAAFELGCIYLDDYDFIGARRIFEKIVDRFPDPSVSLAQVYVRIALCQSFLGEPELAEASLAMAADSGDETVYEQIKLVRESLGKITEQNNSIVNNSWTCRLGDFKRYGVMPNVSEKMMKSDLVAAWQFYYEPKKAFKNKKDVEGGTLLGTSSHSPLALETMNSTEDDLVKSWTAKSWRPAGHLLFDSGKVFFKSAADMIAFDTEQILSATQQDEADSNVLPIWRSMWRNNFSIDDATKTLQAVRRSFSSYGRRRGASFETDDPAESHEVQLFGDNVFLEASIHNGTLYSIEGSRFDDESNLSDRTPNAPWNASFRRTRSNFLTAYDVKTGMTLWTLPKQDGNLLPLDLDSEWLAGGGFMSAPIGYGNLLLAPINHAGSIWVYALDPAQEGKTVWKSFLCDEPETGASAWPAIDLSLDGSDLFVSCGMGVVFILDPSTGMVRFARRYQRDGSVDTAFRTLNWNNPKINFDGWTNDVIIPFGRQMICFSSDTNKVSAYDRNTGELIWQNPNDPRGKKVEYLLGVYNGILYAAGRETIVAFNLNEEGRMVWGGEQIFDGKTSYGRGMLTPNGIYIPVGKSIYKFDLDGDGVDAKKLAAVNVQLGTDAPVGNLYSDGKRIWVHGGNRVYALQPAEPKQDSTD